MRSLALSILSLSLLTLVACESNEADFTPCSDNADCDTGYACIERPEASIGVCAEDCTEGCTTGYGCGGAGDLECVALPSES